MPSPLEISKAGRYQIVRELGRGAMGIVYQGFDPVINRTVAIKTMKLEGLSPGDYEEYKKRFQREAQAAGVLSHPNIVTVHDFGEDNGILYLAMEFLKGVSLEDVLRRQKMLSVDEVVRLFDQVSSALDHAHRHQVVHRDIKPANIMLLDNGRAKVTDFGIARLLTQGTGMTRVGQVVGTPSYMSPEQVRGLPVDGRSDIFSLGVILYLALTGRKPFEGPSLTSVIYKIVNEEPVPPSEVNKDLPAGLSAVVSRALAKDPNRRYQTCSELYQDLKNCASPAAAGAAPAAAPRPAAPVGTARPASGAVQPAAVQPPKVPVQAASPAPVKAAPPAPGAVAAKAPLTTADAQPASTPKARRQTLVAVAALVIVAGLLVGGYLARRQGEAPQPAERTGRQAAPANSPVLSGQPTGAASAGSVSPNGNPAGAPAGPSTTPATGSPPPATPVPTPNVGSKTVQTPANVTQAPAPGQNRAAPAESAARASHDHQEAAPPPEKSRGSAEKSRSAAAANSTPANPAPQSALPSQAAAQQPAAAPASPPPPDQAVTSQLIVETEPTGYDVFVDDKGYGRSDQPVVANITPGKHILSLKKDGVEVYRKPFTQTTDTHEVTIRPQPH